MLQSMGSQRVGPSPGDLADPGIEPMSPVAPPLQADSLRLSHQGSKSTAAAAAATAKPFQSCTVSGNYGLGAGPTPGRGGLCHTLRMRNPWSPRLR